MAFAKLLDKTAGVMQMAAKAKALSKSKGISGVSRLKDTPQIPKDMHDRLVSAGQIRPNSDLTFADSLKRAMGKHGVGGSGMAGGALGNKLKAKG